MNTQYITLILRLHREDGSFPDDAPGKVVGSLQQVGMETISYFDSAEKLQKTLQELVDQGTLPAQAHGSGS